MILVFLGPPEAGKGTQAKLLAKRLGLPHFSIGQLLRDQWQKKTKLGVEGEKYWGEKGINVPSRISFGILEKYLNRAKKGFILDNFPRTEENLRYFKKYLAAKKVKVDHVFHLRISQNEGQRRLVNRAKVEKRLDETPGLLQKRLALGYNKDIKQIKTYFSQLGVWREILGENKPGQVQKEIINIVKTYGTKK